MDIREQIIKNNEKRRLSISGNFTNDLEKGRGQPAGTINKYNEMKMEDGSWKYIKKTKSKGEERDTAKITEVKVSGQMAQERINDIQKRVGKSFTTGVTGQVLEVLKVESMNTTLKIDGQETKIPNERMAKRLKDLKEIPAKKQTLR